MKLRNLPCVILLALAGCAGLVNHQGEIEAAGPFDVASTGNLTVVIEMPKLDFAPGEQFIAKIHALNAGRKPIEIPARTGAPVYVKIWRYTGLYWQEVKRYPQSSTTLINPWFLPGKSRRTFTMLLTVEPDWPTHEPLRITAELNGRADVSPELQMTVSQPEASRIEGLSE